MTLLQKLLSEGDYSKLKNLLGDSFSKLESDFETGAITVADLNAELVKADIAEITQEQYDVAKADENSTADTSSTDNNGADTAGTDTTTTDNTTVVEPATTEQKVLEDGWLVDGNVDLSKIHDETLASYISGLQKMIKDSIWEADYKLAILREALVRNMNNVDDALMYITYDKVSTDSDGKIIGVKEAFDKLKTDKPYLFKEDTAGNNPAEQGFNPVSKVTVKPATYAQAVEQTRQMNIR